MRSLDVMSWQVKMFEVSINARFSAAHHLREYKGKCESQHGHNWDVDVYVRGAGLDKTGMLVDFKDVRENVMEVLDELDHCDLNSLAAFSELNPTSENIAKYLYEIMVSRMNTSRYKISRVSVHETPGAIASYWEEGQ